MNVHLNESAKISYDNEEIVILNLENGIFYGLDEVGTTIWELLQRGFSYQQVVDLLSKEYEVALSQLENDVMNFLEELMNCGLVYK